MKRYFAAAGALLLGTSTVAMAADLKLTSEAGAVPVTADAKLTTDMKAIGTGADKSLIATKPDFGTTTDAKPDFASLNSDLAKMASAETGAKFQTAMSDAEFQPAGTDAKFQTFGTDAKFQTLGTDAKFQTAWVDSGGKFASADTGLKLTSDSGAKLQTASVDSGLKLPSDSAESAKLQVPSDEARAQFASSGAAETKLPTASGDGDELQLTMGDKSQANIGMGGPIEADAVTTAGLTPQPATQNYPPCDPGPGDDRCIQLYEDGVREQLANWNRPTGGLLGQETNVAMGGPHEPVAAESAASVETARSDVAKPASADTAAGSSWQPVYTESELAMNGDGAIDGFVGEVTDTAAAVQTAIAASDVVDHSQFTGVGGPVEAQSGYPPCSNPGPGEDRSIQLYEAGVSGAGN